MYNDGGISANPALLRLRALTYRVGEYGWGPKSEILPGRTAAAARLLHTSMWWAFVWPREWAVRDFRRWARQLVALLR